PVSRREVTVSITAPYAKTPCCAPRASRRDFCIDSRISLQFAVDRLYYVVLVLGVKIMFSSDCDECYAIRLQVARMTLEENSLRANLRYAQRLRDVMVLKSVYENMESLRQCRQDAQRAYETHRKLHSRLRGLSHVASTSRDRHPIKSRC